MPARTSMEKLFNEEAMEVADLYLDDEYWYTDFLLNNLMEEV